MNSVFVVLLDINVLLVILALIVGMTISTRCTRVTSTSINADSLAFRTPAFKGAVLTKQAYSARLHMI